MDKSGDQKLLLTKQLSVSQYEEDRLSDLPESLLCQIMVNLRTIEVVQSCVLSKRWRNLWKYVLGLDVEYCDFQNCDTFVSFVNMFLRLNRESSFQSCKLSFQYEKDKRHIAHFEDWINIVTNRKLQYLDITHKDVFNTDFQLPIAVYTCESLVSLKIDSVVLDDPKLISLPFLKVIKLNFVKFANGLVLEKLISNCPVLESLCINEASIYGMYLLRVCSQSLLSFVYDGDCHEYWDDLEVEIDAPKLEYFSFVEVRPLSIRIKNLESLVEANINIAFDIHPSDLVKAIRDFFLKISCVEKLSLADNTMESISDYLSRGHHLPIFHKLHYLHAHFGECNLKMLSTFLESFPNLKSIVVDYDKSGEHDDDGVRVGSMPKCLLTSLEYVKIKRSITGITRGMKLVSYFLENSAILKKLTLGVAPKMYLKKKESTILKEILTITRLSSSCQVVVL